MPLENLALYYCGVWFFLIGLCLRHLDLFVAVQADIERWLVMLDRYSEVVVVIYWLCRQ